MLNDYQNGQASVVLRLKLRHATTGQGLPGLTSGTASLRVSTIADTEAAATAYTGSNLETVAALGTYESPTSGKARFREVDATSHPGLYELHLAAARLAVAGARSLVVTVSGAANLAECDALVPLRAYDPYAATGLIANVTTWLGTPPNVLSGGRVPAIDLYTQQLVLFSGTCFGGLSQTADNLVITNAGGLSTQAGAYVHGIVVITGNTGYGQGPRVVTGYAGGGGLPPSRTADIAPAWATLPDNTTTFVILGLPGLHTAAIADRMLGRHLAGGADASGAEARSVRNALRASRNRVALDVPAAGQLTVFEEDDVTVAWTGTYARAGTAANPMTDINPT